MDIAVATDSIINGVATIAQETIPKSTPHKASRRTTVGMLKAVLMPAVTNIPNEISRATWTAANSKNKRAGGHRESIKRIFTLFTFIQTKNGRPYYDDLFFDGMLRGRSASRNGIYRRPG
jgi:hypothetical protein